MFPVSQSLADEERTAFLKDLSRSRRQQIGEPPAGVSVPHTLYGAKPSASSCRSAVLSRASASESATVGSGITDRGRDSPPLSDWAAPRTDPSVRC